MANNSNVSNAIYPYDSYPSSFLVGKNANIDANYGPWESTLDYETWHGKKTPSQIKEGTLIAIKESDSSDVTLHVYSNGTWKPVGSGGIGADDIGYVPDNVDVDILEKKVVSTSANQGLNPTQQDNARKNIGAVATDTYNSKVTELTGMIHNLQVADTDPGNAYALRQELTSGLALKADKSNTVTTDTNQTTDENGPITGYKSFTGAVDFAGPTVIGDVTLQGNTVFTEKNPLLRNNTVTINSKTVTINSEVKFPKLDPGILTVDSSGEHKVVTVPASSFTSSSGAYITPDWNNNIEGTNGYIDNKPLISSSDGTTFIGHGPSYEDFSQVLITDDVNAKGNLVLGTYYEDTPNTIWKKTRIYGNVEIRGGNEGVSIGSSQRSTNLTVNGNTTITGNVSLGTGVSDIAKTITLGSTTGAGNVADNININGIITSDVTIGKATPAADNKNLTVNGSLTAIGDVTLGDNTSNASHDTTTLYSQLVYKKPNSYPVAQQGKVEPGVLVRDEDGNVTSQFFIPSVLSMKDLPDTATNGEIYNVAETGDTYKHVVQTVETVDTDLHVSYIDKSDNTRKTLDIDIADTQPAITISTFFSELGTTGYSAFSNYPFIASTKTNLSYDVYVVPVQTDKGICIALVYYMTDPCVAYVVSRWYSGNKANTWYVNDVIHEQGPLIKLFSDLSEGPNKRYVFPVDGDDLSTQVQYFVPNAANNNTQKSWEKIVKSTDLTINGNGTILTYDIITESYEYSEIEDLIRSSKIPLLYDNSNGVYYHYCGHCVVGGNGKYVFESISYDSGYKKVIKVCNETTGSDWTTFVSSETFTEVTNE
jgi:hypothetical protein